MLLTLIRLTLLRIAAAVPILLVVSALLFVALRLLPVDPAAMSMPATATKAEIEAKRAEMGLDQPLPVQYGRWLASIAVGRFGDSIHFRRPVAGLVAQTLPASIELAVCAMAIAAVVGLGGGLLLFHLRGRAAAIFVDLGSIVLLSIPEFMWGLALILLFGVALDALPFTGRLSSGLDRPDITGFLLVDTLLAGRLDETLDALRHMVLPATALGLAFSPTLMRVLNASLLDVYHEDFIAHLRRRGVSETRVLLGHALKNAILPTLNLLGVQFGFLFGGTLLIEVIFSYPGVGNLMVDAVRNADLPIIQIVGLTYCVVVLAITIAVDVVALVLNPKLRARR
jgi:peptide/nickel transport system permease protein